MVVLQIRLWPCLYYSVRKIHFSCTLTLRFLSFLSHSDHIARRKNNSRLVNNIMYITLADPG